MPDVRGRLEALPPANRTADLPTARKDSTHNSSFNIVGSFAGIGFQPLSEELCLEDDSAYRQVEAEVARALEELTRQQVST